MLRKIKDERRKMEPDRGRIELVENSQVLAMLASKQMMLDQNPKDFIHFIRTAVNVAYRIAFSDAVTEIERRERQEQHARHDAAEKRFGGPEKCEADFYRKDLGMMSVCGRNRGHKGAHSWYRDCNQCKGVAGEHEDKCYLVKRYI